MAHCCQGLQRGLSTSIMKLESVVGRRVQVLREVPGGPTLLLFLAHPKPKLLSQGRICL